MPRLVVISDTHNWHHEIVMPVGDIVVHCGDASVDGTRNELEKFVAWFSALSYKHKIMIGGNHDDYLELDSTFVSESNVIFMHNVGATIDGFSFYGSSYRTITSDRASFYEKNHKRSAFMIAEKDSAIEWNKIPTNLDVLITHQPPYGILDEADAKHFGSKILRSVVDSIKPRFHLFGHVHSAYGQLVVDSTMFVNAAICNGAGGAAGAGEPCNKPIIIDL